jgi:hypothetical protein
MQGRFVDIAKYMRPAGASSDAAAPALEHAASAVLAPVESASSDAAPVSAESASSDAAPVPGELAAAGGEAAEVNDPELAAAGGEAAEVNDPEAAEDARFAWEVHAGKRQRALVGAARPEPAEEEPLDAAIARGEVVCSPRAAAWARGRLAIEDGEVDPIHAPLKRPTTDAEREGARAVQHTLFGTPAPGVPGAPSSPHPSEEESVAVSWGSWMDRWPFVPESGEEESAVSDEETEAEADA